MDLNKIQARLDSLQNPQKFKKIDNSGTFWRPQIGKHLVRFMPNKQNPDNPFQELYFYYNLGPKVMLSPISYGEKCPIVEFTKTLKKSSDPEDWKLAKKLTPKMRIFAPVVVRGEESKGVRFYEFGKQVYQELLALAADEEIGDFTDVLEGRDIKVDVKQGATYKETSVRATMKTSPSTEIDSELEKWLNEQPDLVGCYKKYTFEEIKEILSKSLNPEEENVEEKQVTTEQSQAFPPPMDMNVPSVTKKAPQKAKEVITESEFDDLFEDEA